MRPDTTVAEPAQARARLCAPAARDLLRGEASAVRDVLGALTDTSWNDLLGLLSPALHPFLEFRLSAANAGELIPPGAQRALTRARDAAMLTELVRRDVLRTALSTLAANAIETVVLKGAALAHVVYPEPYLRPMTDIDIWVPAARLSDAATCLLKHGFDVPQSGLPEGRLSPAIGQRRLRSARSGVLLELHGPVRSLQTLSEARIARCWARSVPSSICGHPTRTLSPEDALLHTCLHLAMTNRFAHSQVSLLDVSLIIDRSGGRIDFVEVARDACRENIAAYLTVALDLARTVWAARVPDDFFAAVGDVRGFREMTALALEQIWEPYRPLPSALELVLRLPTAGARVAAILQRVVAHHWQPPVGEARHPRHIARQAADRLLNDMTVKVPAYVRAWLRGDLGLHELQRRGRLAARRGRIGVLAGEAEATLRDVNVERPGTGIGSPATGRTPPGSIPE